MCANASPALDVKRERLIDWHILSFSPMNGSFSSSDCSLCAFDIAFFLFSACDAASMLFIRRADTKTTTSAKSKPNNTRD